MRTLSVCCLLLLVACSAAVSEVLVNEALVNEPGSAVTLEWIELYNDSSDQVDLAPYILLAGPSSISLGTTGFLSPNSYLVICRKVLSSGGTPGFEEVWGNNSGVWGDAPQENFRVIEASLALPNSSGTARLFRSTQLVSQLNWPASGTDSVSWERVSPVTDDAALSEDPGGSTPGRVNSVAPVAADLTVDTVVVEFDSGAAQLTVTVINLGFDSTASTHLVIHTYDPVDTTGIGDTLQVLTVAPLGPGDTVRVEAALRLPGLYALLGATVDADDRTSNNQFLFRAPGEQFPPLAVTEFLANPTGALSSEWVELLNISDSTIDLKNWRVGDQTSLRVIIPSTLQLAPDDRIVLAQDTLAFRQFYTTFSGNLYQPTQWPALNNDGDLLRLVDPYGFEAGRFVYSSAFPDNLTWARDETDEVPGAWGQSADTGGTPGQKNVLRQPATNSSQISVDPQVFSPDGDGFEDATTITVQAPPADGYTLRIYDRVGRLVRTFIDNAGTVSPSYQWNGRADGGEQLPIGIYICYFEAHGVESLKKTVVIAR